MKVPPLLESAARNDRLGHAYLFYGRDPREYEPAVLDLFRGLACPRKPGFDACGSCPDCPQIDARSHPDLHILDATVDADGSPRRSDVGVSTVRSRIVDPASLTPARSRYKLFWLNDMSRFTAEACNSILKVLEEPPGDALFVLTARSRREVLPTIQSRCQWIRFEAPAGQPSSILERCRQIEPDVDLDEERLESWGELLAGRRRSGSFDWNRRNTRLFLVFVLILIHRKYTRDRDAIPVEDEVLDRISYRHVPVVLDRLDELERYANSIVVVNSLLEDLFFPGEDPQWANVI